MSFSFGHGILEVMNSTYALWTWHRNQDVYNEDSHGDQIYIVRQPELCSKTLKPSIAQAPSSLPPSPSLSEACFHHHSLLIFSLYSLLIGALSLSLCHSA
ncbi:hypothetical protein ACJW30_12G159600 [Castanea mollissima]